MKLINTYDDRNEAEEAERILIGDRRLASERDASVIIYNLFGIPSWGNFHRLGMYNLNELKKLLECRSTWQDGERIRHAEIVQALQIVAKNYNLDFPTHWK